MKENKVNQLTITSRAAGAAIAAIAIAGCGGNAASPPGAVTVVKPSTSTLQLAVGTANLFGTTKGLNVFTTLRTPAGKSVLVNTPTLTGAVRAPADGRHARCKRFHDRNGTELDGNRDRPHHLGDAASRAGYRDDRADDVRNVRRYLRRWFPTVERRQSGHRCTGAVRTAELQQCRCQRVRPHRRAAGIRSQR